MNLFTKMDVKAVQDGLIRKLGGVKYFAVIAAIASYANDKGEAYPSQDKIADIVGYSRKTINSTIKELRDTEINGEPVIRVVQENTSKGRRNKYVISPYAGFRFGNEVKDDGRPVVKREGQRVVKQGLQEQYPLEQEPYEQEKDIIFDNARAVLDYFRQRYFNKYNVAYQPNWGRDQAMIKNKLLSNFTDSQIKTIVDVAIDEYDKRWASPRFPRPSIGQLCTWLANEALAVAARIEEESQKAEAASKKYEMNDDYFQNVMDEI